MLNSILALASAALLILTFPKFSLVYLAPVALAPWLVALGRSFSLRPTLVTNDEIVVRFGLVFSLRIPFSALRRVTREPIPGALVLPRNSTPNLYLEFEQPLEAERLLGITQRVTALGLCADDEIALTADLRGRLLRDA